MAALGCTTHGRPGRPSQLEARPRDGAAIHRRPCPGRSTLLELFHVRGRRLSPQWPPGDPPVILPPLDPGHRGVDQTLCHPRPPRYHPAVDRGVMPLAEPGVASGAHGCRDRVAGSREKRLRRRPMVEPENDPRKPRHDTTPSLHLRGAPADQPRRVHPARRPILSALGQRQARRSWAGGGAQREKIKSCRAWSHPRAGPIAQASGSSLTNGMLSHRLPAATMQLRPCGEVLTTVQVPLSSDA
jgi:hypothetical protein